MLAYQLEIAPANKTTALRQRPVSLDAQQLDCLTAIMLKILDNKCKMDAEIQQLAIDIYRRADKQVSLLFDLAIHPFIEKVLAEPDIVSLKHVHEMRLFVESAIPKPIMKQFKRDLFDIFF